MSHLILLPVLLPLTTGAALLLLSFLGARTERTVSLMATLALVPASIALLMEAGAGDVSAYYVGAWPAPFGIILVLDRLSALMLLVTALLASGAVLYSTAGDDQRGPRFHALLQFQLLGINGAFLTGDVFNLFVCFEILLIASYALLMHGAGRERTRAALHVVALNLVGSALFLIAVGAIYAATGTLNMADLAARAAEAGPQSIGLLRAGALLLLVVFALKAAAAPLGFWLAPAYAAASAPAAALFAIMTKVGIYAMLRVHGLAFGDGGGAADIDAGQWLLPAGLVTAVLGTIGVAAARELPRLVACLIMVSAGNLLVALGLDSEAGSAAAVFYLLNTTLITGGLFLLGDLVARQRGTAAAALDRAAPVSQPLLLGGLYFIAAIGAAGLPPLGGYMAKLWVLQSAMEHAAAAWVLGILLVTSLCVVVAMARSGSALFWRTGTQAPSGVTAAPRAAGGAVLLLAGTVVMSVAAGPVGRFAEQTAAQLADRQGYIAQVLANRGAAWPAPPPHDGGGS